MRSAPFTCCSIGAATLFVTTSALAPGYVALTVICGGVISGYWAMGRLNIATAPASVMTIEMTDAQIGLAVLVDDPDEVALRALEHRTLRHDDGAGPYRAARFRAHELARLEHAVGIRDFGAHEEGAGLRIERRIDERDAPAVGIDRA